MEEVLRMIPRLTKFFVQTIWTGADWISETFISYCEILIRTAVHAFLTVIVAVLLIKSGIYFDSNLLLLLGILIGGGGLIYFAVVSSPVRMATDWLSELSAIAKQEIERLSNIIFLFMVTIFYLGIDQGQRHPVLLKIFLGTMILLFFAAILPGQSKSIIFFKKRFQALIFIPVVLMTVLALTPEAIANRIFNGHGLEQVTGTVAMEIVYHLDNQEQIINDDNGQPIIFFDQIASKNSKQPRPLIGWTQDKKNQYHLYRWFDGQTNYNGIGQEIKPMTAVKIDDIITQAKLETQEKAADEQRLKEEQQTAAEAEALKQKIKEEEEERIKRQSELDAANESYQKQEIQESQTITNQNVETEFPQSKESEQEITQPVVQLIPVPVSILPPNKKFTEKNLITVRPDTQFSYQDKVIRPYQSIITLAVINVESTSEKDQYMITAQPQSLLINSIYKIETHDISSRTEPIHFLAKKDNSHSIEKIIIGTAVGAGIGAIIDGKRGATKGAVIGGGGGAVYAIASHGKKFQLPASDSLPPIMFKQ